MGEVMNDTPPETCMKRLFGNRNNRKQTKKQELKHVRC